MLEPTPYRGLLSVAGLDFLARAINRRIHYAWVMVVCSMVIVGASAGVRWSFGVLIVPMSEQFGWDSGVSSFAYFVVFISAIPITMIGGWYTDKHGIRLMLPVGVAVFTLGMALTSTVTEIYQFYIFYGVLVGGVHMVFSALLTATVTRWFHRRIGLAVGLVFSVTALALLFTVESTLAARAVLGVLTLFASLEAFAGFCAGCFVFNHLMRWGFIPESVCRECVVSPSTG